MRRTLLVTGLLALCTASAADDAIRILTYNIHHGAGTDDVLDIERIARVVIDTQPDVVCLQEVDRGMGRTEGIDIPAVLSKLLNMNYAFGANLNIDGGEYGNATFSRYPIIEHENLRLPNVSKGEQRGALKTILDLGGRVLTVWNTHFDLTPEARKQQAAALAERLDDTLTVVAGDLNETDTKAGVRLLLESLSDAASLAGKPVEGTIGGIDSARIDYVLISRDLGAIDWQVIRTEEAQAASDHSPVLAVISLRPAATKAADRGVYEPEDERIEEALQEGTVHE